MKQTDTATILIRKADPIDAQELSVLCSRTFFDTYHLFNSEENMHNYITSHFSIGQLSLELSNKDITIYVAELIKSIVGYIKLDNKSLSSLPDKQGIEISRFYVDKKYQEHKIGKKLMNKALKHTLNNKYSYIWLGVWQENERAIEIYKHLKFEIIGTTTFILGDDPQQDFIMVRNIEK